MSLSLADRGKFAPIALVAALATPTAAQDAAEQAWCEITVSLESGQAVVLNAVLVSSRSALASAGSVFERLDQAIVGLQANIDALRSSAQASDPEPLLWLIAAARPSHLYYTAQNLFWKVRLRAVEVTSAPCLGPDSTVDDIATLDVVVDFVKRANHELRRMLNGAAVATSAGASMATDEPAARLAANLLTRMLAASRQLDTALRIEYAPSDIYDRIEEALRLLGRLTDEPLPPLPAPGGAERSVADVYLRVFRCLRLSQVLEVKRSLQTERGRKFALSQWHGVDAATNAPSLQIDPAKGADLAAVDRAHVYDLATLVIAHLAGLGEGGSGQAGAYARPPVVTSSDVYRLASALESQLLKMTGITPRAGSDMG